MSNDASAEARLRDEAREALKPFADEAAHAAWDRAKDNWTCTLFETSARKYQWAAGELRALEPGPASGEYVVVPRSILTDTKEALEQTDDWHVAGSENWILYHQIDTLLHPETIGLSAATKDGSVS
jgi:hypothetical protein